MQKIYRTIRMAPQPIKFYCLRKRSASIFKLSVMANKLFAVSLFFFLVSVALAGALLEHTPPPRRFTVSGQFTLPASAKPIQKDLQKQPAAHTVKFYKSALKEGESLSLIALQRNIDLGTLLSVNRINRLERFKQGGSYLLPTQNGQLHRVKTYESLAGIAEKHNISLENLLAANGLNKTEDMRGKDIFIPGAKMTQRRLNSIIGQALLFPVPAIVNSYYGQAAAPALGLNLKTDGLTLKTQPQQEVYASAAGQVVETGLHPSYGYYIVIAHRNNLQTFYGHLENIQIRRGAKVRQGQTIGRIGASGRSAGNILHFSVFQWGKPVDPLLFLK